MNNQTIWDQLLVQKFDGNGHHKTDAFMQ